MTIKSVIQKTINRIILRNVSLMYRVWRKNNRYCNPRYWSNDELKRFAHLFSGDIINVSAGADRDKEGGFYRDYFINSSSYTISNYKSILKGDNSYNEIKLNLNVPLPSGSDIISRFDVAFSHTVLEHVYDVKVAIDNLRKITKDIVITIAPFIQTFHHNEKEFHDYWRISPYAIISLFNEYNLKTIYITWNNDPFGNIYIFHIASKHPGRWDKISNMQGAHEIIYGPGYYRQVLLSNSIDCPDVKINTLNDII